MDENIWFGIGALAFFILVFLTYITYDNKLEKTKAAFREANKKFYNMAEGVFAVQTNGKKIRKWDKEHIIDYIINENAQELIAELKIYNDLKVWWQETMPNIKREIFALIEDESNSLLLLKWFFTNNAKKQINEICEKYNPEKIKFHLVTYTYYEEGEEHYDPSTGMRITSGSTLPSVTFSYDITPDELYDRIQFLSQFDFSITHYQYNYKNQRALMTPELRWQVIARDKSTCQICGKHCNYTEIEIDHIQPISKGGKTVLSNLQVLCVNCNRRKSNKWLDLCHLTKEDFNQGRTDEYYNEENCLQTRKSNHQYSTKKNSKKYYDTTSKKDNSKIKWIEVESTNVKQIYYSFQKQNLYVMFRNNSIYVYYNVEKSLFMEFLTAPSRTKTISIQKN